MKLVAEVSSSTSSVPAPASSISAILAACEVLPEALLVVKESVVAPPGSAPMKAWISVAVTARPSSARTLAAVGSATTASRPSPGTWL